MESLTTKREETKTPLPDDERGGREKKEKEQKRKREMACDIESQILCHANTMVLEDVVVERPFGDGAPAGA